MKSSRRNIVKGSAPSGKIGGVAAKYTIGMLNNLEDSRIFIVTAFLAIYFALTTRFSSTSS
jgi:hypothetical protein